MSGLVALAVVAVLGVALVVLAISTARPPRDPVPDTEGYLDRWRPLHGGVDPRASAPLRRWLVLGYAVARPLARRGVRPDVLTLTGAWLACAALAAAAEGGAWQVLGGVLVVVSGLADTLDGAVAAATDRTSAWGYVVDSVTDRVTDVVLLLALWVVGAPPWLVLLAGVTGWLIEYARARGRNAGGTEVGTITVGERAVRVIAVAVGVLFGAVLPPLEDLITAAAAAVLAVAGVVGVVQVLVAIHRDLSTAP
ncbi:CDP-alcohol phosphatidyltransferase family protein [Euzebya sp.]|uniref:CDP-alcohol phosphatidyltransferase family protein n=1 Tax=Euzebya sp. TaxID=1971409 RepID=UPI003513C995